MAADDGRVARLPAKRVRIAGEALPPDLAHLADGAFADALGKAVGFAGGLRRSELVALDREDLRFTADGLVLRIRQSKADQEGEGAEAVIARGRRPETCPVRALEAWLRRAGIGYGAVFRRLTRPAPSRAGSPATACGRSCAAARRWLGSRSMTASGCRRTACAPASSPRPICTAPSTGR